MVSTASLPVTPRTYPRTNSLPPFRKRKDEGESDDERGSADWAPGAARRAQGLAVGRPAGAIRGDDPEPDGQSGERARGVVRRTRIGGGLRRRREGGCRRPRATEVLPDGR